MEQVDMGSAGNNARPINLDDPEVVTYWCEELSLTPEELKNIVEEVGPSIEAVRQYLARKMLESWPLNY